MDSVSSPQSPTQCVVHRSIYRLQQREHVVKSPRPVPPILVERYAERVRADQHHRPAASRNRDSRDKCAAPSYPKPAAQRFSPTRRSRRLVRIPERPTTRYALRRTGYVSDTHTFSLPPRTSHTCVDIVTGRTRRTTPAPRTRRTGRSPTHPATGARTARRCRAVWRIRPEILKSKSSGYNADRPARTEGKARYQGPSESAAASITSIFVRQAEKESAALVGLPTGRKRTSITTS